MDELAIHKPFLRSIQAVESTSHLPANYNERFKNLVASPDFSETIFAHIANGGTLITLAESWGVRFSDVAGYLAKNKQHEQSYRAALVARTEWETERLLQELRAIATVDIREAYKPDGTLKDMKDIPAHVAAAISSVDTDELFAGSGDERELIGYTKRVKFWDKAKSIEMFMKKHGLLVERHRFEQGARLEDLVHAANVDDAHVVDAEIVPDQKPEVIPKEHPLPGEKISENHSA